MPRGCRCAVLIALALTVGRPGLTETVYPVVDLKEDPAPVLAPMTDGREVFVGDGFIFFAGTDTGNGRELWSSDGTPAGTRLLMDINPGPGASDPGGMVAWRRWVYFFADDGSHGFELWRTEGTASGTELVRDLCPGSCDGVPGRYLDPRSRRVATVMDDTMFFVGNDGVHGFELWRTEGSAAGATMVADLWPGEYGAGPLELTPLDGVLYFSARASGLGRLWRSDGTAAGTFVVSDVGPIEPYFDIGPTGLAVFGHELYFTVWQQSFGIEVWRSNGTAEGTAILKDICPGSCSGAGQPSDGSWLKGWGGAMYFGASTPETGYELWQSDGAAAGTALVSDFNPGPANGLGDFLSYGGTLLLAVDDGVHGTELWVGDGTVAGSHMVHDFRPGRTGAGADSFVAIGDVVFFCSFGGLWRTDGSLAGTEVVFVPGALPGGSTSLHLVAPFAESLLFFASTFEGTGLLLTDGSRGGERPIALVPPSSSGLPGAYPRSLTPMAGGAAFATGDSEMFLWHTTGEPGNVVSLSTDPVYGSVEPLLAVGDTLYFGKGVEGLWRTNLITRTPTRIYQRPYSSSGLAAAAAVGESVFFVDDLGRGPDLYVTDGTAAGTRAVKQMCPELCTSDLPDSLTPFGDRLLFTAIRFGAADGALWATDGTEAGTVQLAALGADDYRADIDYGIVSCPGRAYVTLTRASTGSELWRTDGTASGTVLVKDICPGRCSGVARPVGRWATPRERAHASGNRLYFLADDGVHGRELWVTDGTAETTWMVADLTPGSGGSTITWLTGAGPGAFFVFDDGVHGRELWHTGGTAGDTVLVEDIHQGLKSADPQHLAWADGVLFFAASDGDHGLEPWRSDGAPNGTRQIADLVPGRASSSPQDLARSGRRVFFRAFEPHTGFELWAIELDGNERVRRRVAHN